MAINKNNQKYIYAIILTYDANHIYVDHLLYKMQELWSDANLIYRIPYNNKKPIYIKEKYKNLNIEFIKTNSQIKKTVLTLIEDLDANDWVYWCIDDKFPTLLNKKKINFILDKITNIDNSNLCGLSFCRAKGTKKKKHVEEKEIDFYDKLKILKKTTFWAEFWVHQFFRVKILRLVFNSFPDDNFQAKQMDFYIQDVTINKDYEFYVTKKNHIVFFESASRGIATKSLKESLRKSGISNYSNKVFSNKIMLIGRINTFKYYSIILNIIIRNPFYVTNRFLNVLLRRLKKRVSKS